MKLNGTEEALTKAYTEGLQEMDENGNISMNALGIDPDNLKKNTEIVVKAFAADRAAAISSISTAIGKASMAEAFKKANVNGFSSTDDMVKKTGKATKDFKTFATNVLA